MAQPLQYQSQFVPTNFGAVGQLTNFLAGDISQRDKYFDAAVAAESEALGALGSIPTSDIEGRQQRVDSITKAMEEAVAKRGGDYGAAARDLSRIIASEKANPWYQVNTQLQQSAADRRKLALNADNMIIGANPNMSVAEAQQMMEAGQDPFTQSALSKSALYDRAGDIAANYAKAMLDPTDPQYGSVLGGQYFVQMIKKGVPPEELEAFIDSGAGSDIMQSMMASYPELQGANESQAREIIKQGLHKAMGSKEIKTLANRAYLEPQDLARRGGNDKAALWNSISSFNKKSFDKRYTTFGLKDKSFDDSGNLKDIIPEGESRVGIPSQLRKKHGEALRNQQELVNWGEQHIPNKVGGMTPKQIYDIKKKVDEKWATRFDSLWDVKVDGKLMGQAMKEKTFINKDGSFGDFINRDIYVNGEKLVGEDKVQELAESLGYKKDDEEFIKKLKNVSTGRISFTGTSPGSMNFTAINDKNESIEIEVSNDNEVQNLTSDVYNISQSMIHNDNTPVTMTGLALQSSTGETIPVDHVVVRTDINQDTYEPSAVIEAYDEDGNLITDKLTLEDIAESEKQELTKHLYSK